MASYCYKLISRFWADEDGVTSTEYAVMVALILVMCIAALLSTGEVQKAMWSDTADKLQVIVPSN